MQQKLEDHLNRLHGEVITVLPHVESTFQEMGATSKVVFCLSLKE
jgi:hypothetical protein